MIFAAGLLAIALTTGSQSLELIGVHRLNVSERFDLSGIVKVDPLLKEKFKARGDFLIVNDHSSIVYDAKISAGGLDLEALIDLRALGVKEPFDLEAIDSENGKLFIVNEAQENVIVIDGTKASDLQILLFHPSISERFPSYAMGNRFGLEGIAVSDDRIFLAKEKTPLSIFEMDSKNSKVSIHEKNPIGSQADLKIQGDEFYILERERRCILQTKLPLQQTEFCWSFAKAIEDPEADYFRLDPKGIHQPQWGNAEALEIEEDDFWLGIDNNGNSLKTRNETRPALLHLRRHQAPITAAIGTQIPH